MRHVHTPQPQRFVLHYALHRIASGHVLMAATEQGVAAVLLGDSAETLMLDLQQRFPLAQLHPGGALLQRWGSAVLAVVSHPSVQHMVPLDVLQGTAFQHKVWRALRSIPAGQTRTYGELARSIGHPQAMRAVASACAANPVAVLVPCHRVLRSDGGLGGYRWGLERKQRLLQLEAQYSHNADLKR